MPSKYGTVSNLRWRFSSRLCNAGAVNSSGTHGIRKASHTSLVAQSAPGGAITPNQGVGRRVVGERCVRRELGNDALSEHLAELHSPLVKRVDVPQRALR